MGLGAERGLTQVTAADLLRDTYTAINRAGDQIMGSVPYIGTFAGNTSAAGQLTIAHNLGFVPSAMFVIADGGANVYAVGGISNFTTTTATCRFLNVSAVTAISCRWMAFR